MTNSLDSELLVTLNLGIILLVSTIFQFGWTFHIQTLIHILSIFTFTIFIFPYLSINEQKRFYPFLIFILIACLSFFWAPVKYLARNELLNIVDGIICLFLISYINNESKQKIIYLIICIGVWLSIILLINFILNPFSYFFKIPIPKEFIVNLSIASGYLVISFFLSLLFWKNEIFSIKNDIEQNKSITIFPLFITGLIFLGILFTSSRNAIFITSILFIFYLYIKKLIKKRLLILILLITCIIVYILTLIKISQQGETEIGIINNRLKWWQTSINMFLKRPILGVGWGNFSALYPVYQTQPGLKTLFTHNILLQIVAEIGLIGLVSFIFLNYYAIRTILKNNNFISNKEHIYPILLSLIAFISLNLIDYQFYIPGTMFLFWTILGISFKIDIQKPKKNFLVHLSFFLFILLIYFIISLKPYLSYNYYKKGLKYMKNNSLTYAEKYFYNAIKLDTLSWEPLVSLAELYFNIYVSTKDEKYLNYAIKMQENAIYNFRYSSVLWSDLSWLYWVANKKESARKAIINAVRFDRFNENYQKTLKLFFRENS